VGAVNVTDVVAVHPFASVAVKEYAPAQSPVIEAVVAPVDQAYE